MEFKRSLATLEEVIEKFIDYRGKTPKKTSYGIPLITAKIIKEGFIQEVNEFIAEEDYEAWMRRGIPMENDVVLTTEAPLGEVALITTDKKIALAQRVITLRGKEDVLDNFFLKYSLQGPVMQARLRERESGSTVTGIKSSELKKVIIEFPNIEFQRRIGTTLKSLDDKISINKKMISNLEQLAQTLFQHWFINFEFPNEDEQPYKSSGGKMIESEIGDVPEKWKIGTLNDLGKILGGGTPSKKIEKYYTENEISWITPKDLSNDKSIYIYKGATDITEEALNKSSANLMPENTVLFSSRAPIGYVAIAGKNVATNQGFKSIVPFEGVPSEYVFFLLKHLTPTIEANAGGSTFKEISGSGMKGIKTILPPSMLLLKYKEIVEPLFSKIKFVEKENKVLIDLRDTLLPKLLSGEIKLSDETEKVLNNIGS